MRQEVRDGFVAFTEQFEGSTTWLYLDVKGLVTIGFGNLVDPFPLANGLTFVRPDGSTASPSEVSAAWLQVKNRQDMRLLGGGAFKSLTTLRATSESIARLVASKLGLFDTACVSAFPDWESWPAPAQTATLSMCWAMGTLFLHAWPAFRAACLAHDWNAAADACHMNDDNNPGLRPRNASNVALFRQAAEHTTFTEPASIPMTKPHNDDEPPPQAA